MKQATGSNTPQSINKVSIQLTLDGHSFSAPALSGEFPGDGPVEVELLTPRTMLVPEELFDKEHVTITMDVPFDCTAEAVLPMVAKSEKEAVAEVLGSEENGRYLLEPGHYEVSYQLSGWKEKTAVCVE